jgi:hypothetical protein
MVCRESLQRSHHPDETPRRSGAWRQRDRRRDPAVAGGRWETNSRNVDKIGGGQAFAAGQRCTNSQHARKGRFRVPEPWADQ